MTQAWDQVLFYLTFHTRTLYIFLYMIYSSHLSHLSQDVFGTSLDHDLIEGGDSVAVNKENRQKFVDLYAGMSEPTTATLGPGGVS